MPRAVLLYVEFVARRSRILALIALTSISKRNEYVGAKKFGGKLKFWFNRKMYFYCYFGRIFYVNTSWEKKEKNEYAFLLEVLFFFLEKFGNASQTQENYY